jgi:hypothetical protein
MYAYYVSFKEVACLKVKVNITDLKRFEKLVISNFFITNVNV